MKLFTLATLISGMLLATQANAYTYQTTQNGSASYGNSPYTDPSFTKLSDGNLGSASGIDANYVHYTTSTYNMAVTAISVTPMNNITVYALKNTANGIDLPSRIEVSCPKPPLGGPSTAVNFTSSSYPDNARAALVIPTPSWGGFLFCGVNIINANSSYTAVSEIVFQ